MGGLSSSLGGLGGSSLGSVLVEIGLDTSARRPTSEDEGRTQLLVKVFYLTTADVTPALQSLRERLPGVWIP